MACNGSSNKSLNPLDNILNQTEGKVSALESQSNLIKPTIEQFRNELLGFDPNNVSSPAAISSALSDFTADAICAGYDDMNGLEKLAAQCLSDAVRGLRQYLDDLLQNLEDGIDLIASLLNLPEYSLMKLFQRLYKLLADIAALVGSTDSKLTCITANDTEGEFTSRVQAYETRINTVLDDLYLDDDGNFDSDKLLADADPNLKTNLKSFESRSNTLKSEIEGNINRKITVLNTNVNPITYF